MIHEVHYLSNRFFEYVYEWAFKEWPRKSFNRLSTLNENKFLPKTMSIQGNFRWNSWRIPHNIYVVTKK